MHNITLAFKLCMLPLRAAQAHAPPWCKDQMELSIFNDGEILRAVSCHPGCSHRSTDKKAHGEGKVRNIGKIMIIWIILHLDSGFVFVYATYILFVFCFILQTVQNGQWGLTKSRGVCVAHAKALHLHTGSLQWQKSDLWGDFAHPAKASATLHRAGRGLCLHKEHQGEHLEKSFHTLPGAIDDHK